MIHLYKESLALLSDLYELMMAYGYWKKGMLQKEAVFHLFFRRHPFQGTFAIAAGLEGVLDYLQRFHFDSSDLAYLETLQAADGSPVFEKGFLDYLSTFVFSCDIDAIPEGTPVFPYEPLVRVRGPLIQAQLLETPLLNLINFQTLIATKAARICFAASPDPVVEFGVRRAQGIDGGLSASRAAYIGGCDSTSNVLAGKLFGIPIKGTHAHSWVMAFDKEEDSFFAYSEVMPHNCLFLVDTYDSIAGVKKAIRVAKELKKKGIEMKGVRLDSGDLAHLSIQIRKILDAEGYSHAHIMASNELDEWIIKDLKQQGAKIDIWGVGTHLVTAKDQSALDGVYKLSAIRDPNEKWQYKVKISEQIAKATDPGILQVRRFYDETGYVGDMIYDLHLPLSDPLTMIDPMNAAGIRRIDKALHSQDLLVPVVRQGKSVYKLPSLNEIRDKTYRELNRFPASIRRFLNPQPYFTGLEKSLFEEKLKLIKEIKSL